MQGVLFPEGAGARAAAGRGDGVGASGLLDIPWTKRWGWGSASNLSRSKRSFPPHPRLSRLSGRPHLRCRRRDDRQGAPVRVCVITAQRAISFISPGVNMLSLTASAGGLEMMAMSHPCYRDKAWQEHRIFSPSEIKESEQSAETLRMWNPAFVRRAGWETARLWAPHRLPLQSSSPEHEGQPLLSDRDLPCQGASSLSTAYSSNKGTGTHRKVHLHSLALLPRPLHF